MTPKDRKQFAQLMLALSEVFGNEASPTKVEVYFKALEDMPIAEISNAVWHVIKTRTTASFPKVAEIREAAHGNLEELAQLAWDKFIGAVRGVGGYASAIFDDPVIHAIIEREGGWIRVTEKNFDEMAWFSKDFVRIYKAYAPNVQNMALPEKLVGIYELDNAGKYDDYVPTPVIIGSTEKALAWVKERRAIKSSGISATILSLAEAKSIDRTGKGLQ